MKRGRPFILNPMAQSWGDLVPVSYVSRGVIQYGQMRLDDILPSLSTNDKSNGLLFNPPKERTKLLHRDSSFAVAFTDFPNLLRRQGRTRRASFHYHVPHVVRVRTKKQVVRSNARRIVTTMKNPQPLWNFAIGEFVRDDVSNAVVGKFPVANEAKFPITKGVFSARPNPTFTLRPVAGCLVYFCPKSFRVMSSGIRKVTHLIAVLSSACLKVRQSNKEHSSAMSALYTVAKFTFASRMFGSHDVSLLRLGLQIGQARSGVDSTCPGRLHFSTGGN